MNKKTVLISGASRGIGRAAALAFAREQDNLIITCQKNKELLDQVKQEAEAEGSVCPVSYTHLIQRLATLKIRSLSATELPPNFFTKMCIRDRVQRRSVPVLPHQREP